MSKLVASFFLIIFLTACEESVNSGNIPDYSKYPVQLNREWEYNTILKIEYYDSNGHIDSTEMMDLGNTICKITSLNDTIGNLTHLICFAEYDLSTPQYVHKVWYLNADSGLYAIAYCNPGSSQIITPKMYHSSHQDINKITRLIGLNPASFEGGKSVIQFSDSIQFYTYPRKVLKYPLRIGERWVELIDPFYRERFINKKESLTINGKVFNCLKVESGLNLGIFFNDYINLTNGLIMREILADSLAIINPEDPNPIGYYRVHSISKLVRVTIP